MAVDTQAEEQSRGDLGSQHQIQGLLKCLITCLGCVQNGLGCRNMQQSFQAGRCGPHLGVVNKKSAALTDR